MDLKTYIKQHGRSELAKNAGTSEAYISQLAGGHRKAGFAIAIRIEAASGGLVSTKELRSDIFGTDTKAA